MIEENISAAPSVESAPAVTQQPNIQASPEVTPVVAENATTVSEPAEVTTLLTEQPKPVVENISGDTLASEPVKTEDLSQSAEPAPLPSYEAFKMPEGTQADTEALGAFTNKLADIEVKSKAEHALLQEFGQDLVNMHVAEVQKTIDRVSKAQFDNFEKIKQDWRQSFVNDPEIGGNRQETTLTAARQFLSTHGGNAEQQAEVRNILDKTGLGNHPAVIRLLANAGKAYSEPKPVPASVIVRENLSKTQKLYGSPA